MAVTLDLLRLALLYLHDFGHEVDYGVPRLLVSEHDLHYVLRLEVLYVLRDFLGICSLFQYVANEDAVHHVVDRVSAEPTLGRLQLCVLVQIRREASVSRQYLSDVEIYLPMFEIQPDVDFRHKALCPLGFFGSDLFVT